MAGRPRWRKMKTLYVVRLQTHDDCCTFDYTSEHDAMTSFNALLRLAKASILPLFFLGVSIIVSDNFRCYEQALDEWKPPVTLHN